MKLKKILSIIRFIKDCESCLVLRDDLRLWTFGRNNRVLRDYEEVIMNTRIDKDYIGKVYLKGYIARQPDTGVVRFSETVPFLTGDRQWINGDSYQRRFERLPVEDLDETPYEVEITLKIKNPVKNDKTD